jgi:ankyrin repeat protein
MTQTNLNLCDVQGSNNVADLEKALRVRTDVNTPQGFDYGTAGANLTQLLPLHHALIFQKRLEIVQTLVRAGALITRQDNQKRTALHHAVHMTPIPGVLEYLLLQKTDTSVRDNEGCTPLMRAIVRQYIPEVRLLLLAGADPNIVGNDGCTQLHRAAKGGLVEIVRLLIEHRADLQTRTPDGRTALQIATTREYHVIMGMLETEAVVRAVARDKCVAFVMGLHKRLGSESAVNSLSPELVRDVVTLV